MFQLVAALPIHCAGTRAFLMICFAVWSIPVRPPGALETMLDRVATYKEKTEQLKAKIKKALTYPIAVAVVAVIVTAVLLIKVVPVFAETFSSFGADLPAFTLFVLGLSEALQESWVTLLVCIGAAFYGFKEARFRSQKFAYAVDKYTLKTADYRQHCLQRCGGALLPEPSQLPFLRVCRLSMRLNQWLARPAMRCIAMPS